MRPHCSQCRRASGGRRLGVVELGGRQAQVATVAPAVDQAGDAHAVEAGPEPFVRRQAARPGRPRPPPPGPPARLPARRRSRPGPRPRRPQARPAGRRGRPLRLQRRPPRRRAAPARSIASSTSSSRLPRRRLSDSTSACMACSSRMTLTVPPYSLAWTSASFCSTDASSSSSARWRRTTSARRRRPRPGTRRARHARVLDGGQLGQLGQRPRAGGGAVDRRCRAPAPGGACRRRPWPSSPGCRFNARSRAWAMRASMSGMVISGIVGAVGARRRITILGAVVAVGAAARLGLVVDPAARWTSGGSRRTVSPAGPGTSNPAGRSGRAAVKSTGSVPARALRVYDAPDLRRVGAAVDGDTVDVAHRDVLRAARPSTRRWRGCGCSRRTRRWCCCRWTRSCRRRPSPTTRAAVPVPRWTTWVSTSLTWRATCWEMARSPLGLLRKMTLPSRSSTRSTT